MSPGTGPEASVPMPTVTLPTPTAIASAVVVSTAAPGSAKATDFREPSAPLPGAARADGYASAPADQPNVQATQQAYLVAMRADSDRADALRREEAARQAERDRAAAQQRQAEFDRQQAQSRSEFRNWTNQGANDFQGQRSAFATSESNLNRRR